MRCTDRLTAILDAELTLDDVKALPPAHRRRLASLLHHWWQLTEGSKPERAGNVKAGVLSDLERGAPRHE